MAGSIVLSDNPPQQLKFWRKKFGIKQADLAKKMDITPSVLSDYEKGRRPSPGVNFIKRYLLALYDLSKGEPSASAGVESGGKEPASQSEPAAAEMTQDTVHINQPGWFCINMPLIQVSLYPGRSLEQKEKYAKAITDAAVEILKTKPEHVIVVFDEKPKENWFKSGQQM